MERRETINSPGGIVRLNPNYTHPELVIVNDSNVLPITLCTNFFFVLLGKGILFSGKQPTQVPAIEEHERMLFGRPYREWAPAPYNTPRISADSGINRALSAISGFGDLLSIVTSTSSHCDRDLHHLKTRLLSGMPPMSLARWRQKGLHETASFTHAFQHLSVVADAFEFLNLPQNQSRMRNAYHGVWDACNDFQTALNAHRAEGGLGAVSVTAVWEEYMVDYFQTVAARAHAWVLARIDELRESQLERLRRTTAIADEFQVSPEQMEIQERLQDLYDMTNQADAYIMLPLHQYKLQTLTSAVPSIRSDWRTYKGQQPITQLPLDVELRSYVYAMRCRYLEQAAILQKVIVLGGEQRVFSDPARLEANCQSQVRECKRARAELRGSPPPELGEEPWICQVNNVMRVTEHRPIRVWGFIGYRICYEHSDDEWKAFLESFKSDVTSWGEGVGGAAEVKRHCKVRWLDGREHGIPEGDIAAAKRHYETYVKSSACEAFQTARAPVFLAADRASIDSYLNPIRDDAELVVPRGDFGSFILTVKASADTGDEEDAPASGPQRQEADVDTLRVLGSVLFDDYWALLFASPLHFEDLAMLAAVHPRQVYVGSTVPFERQAWKKCGVVSSTVLKSFERWRSL